MKTTVDPDLCIGCELCASIAPDVYEMDGSISIAIEGDVPAEYEDDVRSACDDCPVTAIEIQE